MRQEEIELVENCVAIELMPEIKALIPELLGFIFSSIFPRRKSIQRQKEQEIKEKIIAFIIGIVGVILKNRQEK